MAILQQPLSTWDVIAEQVPKYFQKIAEEYKREEEQKRVKEEFKKAIAPFRDRPDYNVSYSLSSRDPSDIKVRISPRKLMTEGKLTSVDRKALGALNLGGRYKKDILGEETFEPFSDVSQAAEYMVRVTGGQLSPKVRQAWEQKYGAIEPTNVIQVKRTLSSVGLPADKAYINAYIKAQKIIKDKGFEGNPKQIAAFLRQNPSFVKGGKPVPMKKKEEEKKEKKFNIRNFLKSIFYRK